MCENTDITWLYVRPVDCHKVVSIWWSVLVIKSQCMQQLMYNYSMPYASKFAALEVQLLGLWVIENLWLTVVRQERHFVTIRSLIVAYIGAEATMSRQTWWIQQNMWVDKYVNRCVFRSYFNRCTTSGVAQSHNHVLTPNTSLSIKPYTVFPEPNIQVSSQRPLIGLCRTHCWFVTEWVSHCSTSRTFR
jgi:hypothetical protein